MMRILLIGFCCLVLLGGLALNADEEKEKAAREAAEAWLAMVDSGRYGESWDAASSMFKDKVPRDQWEKMASSAREPLGAVKSREFKNADYMTEVPGAPDGEYVVIQYISSFANKKSAVETIMPMMDTDGQWHVSSYFFR